MQHALTHIFLAVVDGIKMEKRPVFSCLNCSVLIVNKTLLHFGVHANIDIVIFIVILIDLNRQALLYLADVSVRMCVWLINVFLHHWCI